MPMLMLMLMSTASRGLTPDRQAPGDEHEPGGAPRCAAGLVPPRFQRATSDAVRQAMPDNGMPDNGRVSDSSDRPRAEATPTDEASPRKRARRRVVRQGTEREPVFGETADDRGGHADNDDRLLRDVPPHWGRR